MNELYESVLSELRTGTRDEVLDLLKVKLMPILNDAALPRAGLIMLGAAILQMVGRDAPMNRDTFIIECMNIVRDTWAPPRGSGDAPAKRNDS